MASQSNNTKMLAYASISFFLGYLLVYLNPPNTVSLRDMTFCVVYPIYLCLANSLCSPMKGNPSVGLGKGEFLGKPAFMRYMMMFQIFTVLIPGLTIMGFFGHSMSTSKSVKAAVAPLVLLFAQIFMEAMGQQRRFHDVVLVLVPIGFNAFRLLSVYEWCMISHEEYVSKHRCSCFSSFKSVYVDIHFICVFVASAITIIF